MIKWNEKFAAVGFSTFLAGLDDGDATQWWSHWTGYNPESVEE